VLTYTYSISLFIIALLSLIVHIMLDRIIVEQSNTGKVVNLSGQQRMLSQRISLFTFEYLTIGNAESKKNALLAVDKMKKNHQILLSDYYEAINKGQTQPFSKTLQDMYFNEPLNIDKKIKLFTRLVEQSLSLSTKNRPPNSQIDMSFLALAKEPLLSALNTVVEQYEKESLDKVNELRFTQDVVLGIIILTIFIEAFFIFRPMADRISNFASKLQKEANFDHLTGLLNRRSFNLQAIKAVAASHRYKRELAVIIFDIDFFKRINDTYGHTAGDVAIQQVSKILQGNCRESDCVARFGGEEFVMLLPETDEKGSFYLADKIRQEIKSTPCYFEGNSIELAISAGICMLKDAKPDIEEVIRLADEALYQSKNSGRNLVTVYTK